MQKSIRKRKQLIIWVRRYFLPVRGSCTKTEVTCTTGFQKIMNANLAAEIGNQSMNAIVETLPFLSQCMLFQAQFACYFLFQNSNFFSFRRSLYKQHFPYSFLSYCSMCTLVEKTDLFPILVIFHLRSLFERPRYVIFVF